MIKQWFSSKRPPKTTHRPPQQQQHNLTHYNNDILKAQQMGIAVQDYRERQKQVALEVKKFHDEGLSIHMHVRPANDKDFEEAGECVIMGLCTNYDNYGAVRWNDPPLIMQVRSKKHDGYINCTVGWIKKLENVQC